MRLTSIAGWMALVGLAITPCAAAPSPNSRAAIAPTPPMGFNNWARFQCVAQAPLDGRDRASYSFQDFMLDQAKALVDTGLAAAGYRTVVVDDCWMAERGPDRQLHGIARWGSARHPSDQPGFDRDLTRYVGSLHALGLKAGLYNTAGTTTCQRVAAGEQGHQAGDAATFARWGVDFLKLDNCGATDAELPGLFAAMSAALDRSEGPHPILFDESAPAQYAPTDPAKYRAMEWVRPLGEMWRVAPDIRITHLGVSGAPLYDPWNFDDADQGYEEGVYQSFTDSIALSRYMAPGQWNDADQLLLGDSGMSEAEERSQMGLWSVMGAPLVISADLRALALHRAEPRAAATLATLANRRVIAVDQDPLGAGGYLVSRDHSANDMGFDVAFKPLADGGFAVLILNKNPIAASYDLPLGRVGVAQGTCRLHATELWSGAATALDARGSLGGRIAAHDNLLFRVAGADCLDFTPTGQISPAQARFAAPPLCLDAGDAGLTVESCSGGATQRWRMAPDGHVGGDDGTCLAAQGDRLTLNRCAPVPGQRFHYHLSGAITAADGRCITVATTPVGNGGLIGQQGAAVGIAPCRRYAPEQTFSAPHRGPVPA